MLTLYLFLSWSTLVEGSSLCYETLDSFNFYLTLKQEDFSLNLN